MKFIYELIEKLEQKNICMKRSTEEQMEKLYSIVEGKNLPRAYIEFMCVMGNGTEGDYMGGDSCFMNEIFDLRQGAIELLKENGSVNILTDDDFVFWMSQGCMFCFFKLTEGDNPPIYFYNESGFTCCICMSLIYFSGIVSEMDKTFCVNLQNHLTLPIASYLT